MRFIFNLFNQSEIGKLSLLDPMNNIARQLEDLGHEVTWFDDGMLAQNDVVNVVFEGFHPSHNKLLQDLRDSGGKLLIIATEEPSKDGFNHGSVKHMYKRQAAFEEIGHLANAIWYLVPGCSWYEQFAPATFLDLGYSPRLERRCQVIVDHDVGFFGSMTKRRLGMLKKFAAYGLKVHAPGFCDSEKRDREISRCKVVLQLRSFERMGLISSSRCSTALHLGKPVLAEPHENPGVWSKIIQFEDIDQMAYRAAAMCDRWRDEHKEQMARFKELLPARNTVGKALSILN